MLKNIPGRIFQIPSLKAISQGPILFRFVWVRSKDFCPTWPIITSLFCSNTAHLAVCIASKREGELTKIPQIIRVESIARIK